MLIPVNTKKIIRPTVYISCSFASSRLGKECLSRIFVSLGVRGAPCILASLRKSLL